MNSRTSENRSWTKAENKRHICVQGRPGQSAAVLTRYSWWCFVSRLHIQASGSSQSSSGLFCAPEKTHHSPVWTLTPGNTGRERDSRKTQASKLETEQKKHAERWIRTCENFSQLHHYREPKTERPPALMGRTEARLITDSNPWHRLEVECEPPNDRLCKQPKHTVRVP